MSQSQVPACPQNARVTFRATFLPKPGSPVCEQVQGLYEAEFSGRGRGGWRAMARDVGVSASSLHAVAHKRLEPHVAMRTRWLIYLQRRDPRTIPVEVFTCPSCGLLHYLPDCLGGEAEIVIKHSVLSGVDGGETRSANEPVTVPSPRLPRKRKRYFRPCLPTLYSHYNADDIVHALESIP